MFTSRNCRKMVASLFSAFMLSYALVLAGSCGGHGIAYAAEEKTSGFLSEGEAVRFAKKWVEIPERYEQIFAYYITPEDADVSSPAWNLGWGVGEKLGEKQAMYIRIHPSTGKLLSYLFQPTENGDGILAKPVSKEKARENVERFMSRAVSDDERPKLSKPAESVYEKKVRLLPIPSFIFEWRTTFRLTKTG